MAIFWICAPYRGRLGIAARPRGGDWLEDEVRAWRASGVDVIVSLLTPEEIRELDLQAEPDRCIGHGIRFRAFPVPDRGVPGQADAFLALVAELATAVAAGESVVVHCRQGIGRSGITAAAVLALLAEPVDRAFELAQQARGCRVPDTPEQRAWLEALVAKGREEDG